MRPVEDLAREALADIVRMVRTKRLAELERRPDGSLWCPVHRRAVDDDEVLSCPGCVADGDRQREAENRLERLSRIWPEPSLPRWPWARLGNTTWRQGVDRRSLQAARAWNPRRSLLMRGPTGSGKSSVVVARLHSIAAEARAWAERVVDGPCPIVRTLYATEIQLHSERRRWPLGEGEAPLVLDAMRVPCLVLDEVGATRELITHEILDERMRRGLPTVALTGFDTGELVSRVGDACLRRLEQGAIVVDMFEGA